MTERSRGRIAALDGLRGLAVVAVLLFHSQFGFARGGFLGVSAFFTLSGFLITSLLLAPASGHRLRGFWARRARRLLPAALLTLFGVMLFAATIASTDQLRVLRGDVLAALGCSANWRFFLSGQSYADLFLRRRRSCTSVARDRGAVLPRSPLVMRPYFRLRGRGPNSSAGLRSAPCSSSASSHR
jgi:peptidoglycan/LPS O-acetylase OafA/YrhL